METGTPPSFNFKKNSTNTAAISSIKNTLKTNTYKTYAFSGTGYFSHIFLQFVTALLEVPGVIMTVRANRLKRTESNRTGEQPCVKPSSQRLPVLPCWPQAASRQPTQAVCRSVCPSAFRFPAPIYVAPAPAYYPAPGLLRTAPRRFTMHRALTTRRRRSTTHRVHVYGGTRVLRSMAMVAAVAIAVTVATNRQTA